MEETLNTRDTLKNFMYLKADILHARDMPTRA